MAGVAAGAVDPSYLGLCFVLRLTPNLLTLQWRTRVTFRARRSTPAKATTTKVLVKQKKRRRKAQALTRATMVVRKTP